MDPELRSLLFYPLNYGGGKYKLPQSVYFNKTKSPCKGFCFFERFYQMLKVNYSAIKFYTIFIIVSFGIFFAFFNCELCFVCCENGGVWWKKSELILNKIPTNSLRPATARFARCSASPSLGLTKFFAAGLKISNFIYEL